MGKKPLVGLAGLCLAGLIVCGCQDNKQSGGSRRSGTGGSGGVHVPPPTPAPGGSPTAGSGWDTTPKNNLMSRPGGSADPGSMSGGSGLGSAMPLGGSGSGLGSANPGSGMKSPAGGMAGAAGPGLGDTGSPAGSPSGPGLGSQPAPMGVPGGMSGPSRGLGQTSNLSGGMASPHLNDPPPASGMPSSGGFGASGTGSANNLLTPPPPPPAMRPTTGSLNMSDPGAGAPSPNLSQQSNMAGNYRTTVPPGLGASPLPAPPPVPTVNNGTEQ